MSRAQAIRKKALDLVKKREWDAALKEFTRLAEVEEHNPNVFNELGDLHLKVGNKVEAFNSFHAAIDAYERVALFNNAVAVCKKILRLNPNDHITLGKLARLRRRQGFQREAVTYALTFLDKIVQDGRLQPEFVKEQTIEIAFEMKESVAVLERVSEYVTQWEFSAETGDVLARLHRLYAEHNMTAEMDVTTQKLAALGLPPPKQEQHVAAPEIDVEPNTVDIGPQAGGTVSGPPPRHASVAEYGEVSLGEPSDGSAATEPVSGAPSAPPDTSHEPAPETPQPSENPTPQRPSQEMPSNGGVPADTTPAPAPPPAYEPPAPAAGAPAFADDDAPLVAANEIVGKYHGEVKADVEGEDYRSRYDLGMAYLEMDLIPEAIREFQVASQSSMYQVRSLEMIGLCFLKQKQPRLAIKQLEKGLVQVAEGDQESLGLLYNLGLAYEMVGDADKARACFEDVYVVDVTFREVGEKLKTLSGI